MELLRFPLDFGFLRIGNFTPVSYNAIEDENVAVGCQLEKAALVECVAADEQVTDTVEHQSERAENDASLVGVLVELILVVDVVLVLDVEQGLNDLDDDREAERRQNRAHNHHRQDVDASPSESVFQRLLVLMLLLLLLAHVLRHDLFLLKIFAKLS